MHPSERDQQILDTAPWWVTPLATVLTAGGLLVAFYIVMP